MSDLLASVDLGGTKIAAAIADTDGTILAEDRAPTHSQEGPHGVLARIGSLVSVLAARAGARPLALGMGVPGLVDVETGITKFLPNMPTQWRDVPVAAALAQSLGCPVFLLNDARLATLGEFTYGRGRSAGTMVFLTIGTGIGGGVVIDGQLRLGPLGAAGELGHQTMQPDGPLCGCGNRGCLEALASGPAMVGEAIRLLQSGLAPVLYEMVSGNASLVTPREMAAAVRAGDTAIGDAITRAANWLGIGIANIVTVLHPDLVVLGGSVAALDVLLLDPVRASVRERVRMFPAESVSIECSLLEDKAGLLGGIALALSRSRAQAPGGQATSLGLSSVHHSTLATAS